MCCALWRFPKSHWDTPRKIILCNFGDFFHKRKQQQNWDTTMTMDSPIFLGDENATVPDPLRGSASPFGPHMEVSKNGGTPSLSSISLGLSVLNQPAMGYPHSGIWDPPTLGRHAGAKMDGHAGWKLRQRPPSAQPQRCPF